MISRIALFAALVTLAACADVTAPSGPPIAGDNRGSAAPPLRSEGTAQPHSANASAGTPAISGNTGDGRPVVTYSGGSGNTIGGVPPLPRSTGSKP